MAAAGAGPLRIVATAVSTRCHPIVRQTQARAIAQVARERADASYPEGYELSEDE